MKNAFLLTLALGTFLACANAQTPVPNLVNYQGRITVGSTNFTGSGQFKFALVSGDGTTAYWSNDGSLNATPGSLTTNVQPSHAVGLTVSQGLYSALLGDTTVSTFMTVIPTSVWANPDVRLRVWFSDGTNTSQLLTPDQRIAPTGYLASGLTLAGPSTITLSSAADTLGTTSVDTLLGLRLMNSSGAGTFSSPNVTGIGFGQTSTRQAIVGETFGNDGLDFYVSGNLTTPVVRIDANGRLGLGTLNPAYTLDVTGAAHVTTGLSDGGTLSVVGNTSLLGNLTVSGNITGSLNLAATTSATAGVLDIGGTPFVHAYGQGGLTDANTFVGDGAGDFTLTGTGNTGNGFQTLTHLTNGTYNTAAGYQALNADTSGNYNVATGYLALSSNTSGFDNTAVGSSALSANTSGNYNSALGFGALYLNTTGVDNTAGGYDSLLRNTTGADNAAFGFNALNGNTTANKNVALGSQALYTQSYSNNNTGWDSRNVAIGYTALYANQPTSTSTGNNNVAVGYQALYSNTTGSDNMASGTDALNFNTTGSFNTASGHQALFQNTTGGSNTASGYQAIDFNTTGSNNTASGYGANYHNTTGNNNVAFGSQSLFANTTGSNNIALGSNAGGALTTGSNNIDIGSAGVAGESNIIRLGDGSTQTDTYLTGILHAGSTTAGINLNGRVGIGFSSVSNTALYVERFASSELAADFVSESGAAFLQVGTNSGYALIVNKASGLIARTDASSTWDVSSDERIKHDIKPVAGALATLERLRPVRFHYNADFLAKSPGSVDYERFGVVAQEFQKVFPDFVDTNADGMLSVRLDPIPIVTAAAVQELDAADKQRDATIAVLQRQNDALAKSNQALEARLTALEARFNASQPPTRAATPTH